MFDRYLSGHNSPQGRGLVPSPNRTRSGLSPHRTKLGLFPSGSASWSI